MHEIRAAVGLHYGVGQLLELERQFKGGRIVVAAANHYAGLHVAITLGHLGNMVLHVERLVDLLRDPGEHLATPGITAQGYAQQGNGCQLGGIGLGGSDRLFLASREIEHIVGGPPQVRVWKVGDGRSQRALPLALRYHRNNVGALAALADAQHQ